MCWSYKCFTYVILCYCSQFFFSSTSSVHIQLARNFFHLFPCSFIQICFGFLKKTLWPFPMITDGNAFNFIPVFSEKSKFVNLRYVQKNNKNVKKLHFYSQHPLILSFQAIFYTRPIVSRLSTFLKKLQASSRNIFQIRTNPNFLHFLNVQLCTYVSTCKI